MSKLFKLSVALSLALLVSFPVMAAPKSLEVTLVVDTLFDGPIIYPSAFVASGPAVEAGLVCETGVVHDLRTIVAGPPNASHFNFHIAKKFVCDDGSGEFIINLMAHVAFDPYHDVGTWNVLSGLGNYASLHGRGSLTGTPTDTGVLDIYTGWVDQ